jgi:biotin carboxylase
VLASVARETLSFDPIPGGNSVWKRTVPFDDVGVAEALALLRAVEYEGLAEVEYQIDAEGSPRLMEIGVRVHGWIPLAVHAGADLPLIAAQALLGDEPGEELRGRVGAEMRWPKGELNRLRAAFSRTPELPPGTTRRGVIAAAWPPWRPGIAYDGIDLDDPGPWLPAALKRRRAQPSSSVS